MIGCIRPHSAQGWPTLWFVSLEKPVESGWLVGTCGWKLSHQAVLALCHCQVAGDSFQRQVHHFLKPHNPPQTHTHTAHIRPSLPPPCIQAYLSGMPQNKRRVFGPLYLNKGLGLPPSLCPMEQGDHVKLGKQQATRPDAAGLKKKKKTFLYPPTQAGHWSCLTVREIVIGVEGIREDGGVGGRRTRGGCPETETKGCQAGDNKDD